MDISLKLLTLFIKLKAGILMSECVPVKLAFR